MAANTATAETIIRRAKAAHRAEGQSGYKTRLPDGQEVVTWYVGKQWGWGTFHKDASGNQVGDGWWAPTRTEAEDNHLGRLASVAARAALM
jgi:hypothetical protein